MTSGGPTDVVDMATSHEPKVATPYEKEISLGTVVSVDGSNAEYPTEEELATLTRVSGQVPWSAYTIAFVELCERFGYYGCTVVYVNFIQQDMPLGSNTGAGFGGQSGALGMGQRASFGLTTFNSFWAYTTPLLGAYIADEYLGRFRTIYMAIFIAILGHLVLVISAIPPVIVHPNSSIGVFSLGLILLGLGTGCFKANISPLIAEQYRETQLKIVVNPKTGERQISDPTITIARIFLYFYLMVNVGSLTGQISMVYVEKYVGFWCSFLLPTIMFCLCPVVLFLCRNKYNRSPPTGSVLAKALKLWFFAMKGRWSLNLVKTSRDLKDPSFWENVKPSHLGASKPEWMTFDDAWVDQVSRGFKACGVFLFYPLYWLAYNQMNNNLTSQAATMQLHGVPNDVINNLNPLSLIIFIPLVDRFVYPGFRKLGIQFTPLKRMFAGFLVAALAMVTACVIQFYIYKLGECGHHMNSCEDADGNPIVAPINVWVQAVPYILIGFSEIFASITGLEYAFTKAPKNMRSLVTAFFHFQSALSNAIGQAMVALAEDPLLVWNYMTAALVALVGGILFWAIHHKLDKKEDLLNMLPDSVFDKPDNKSLDPERQEKN